MAIGFSEINRVRRERNAARNLTEYARAANIPDPEKAAEEAAGQIHGGVARAAKPARKPQRKAAPKPAAKPAAPKKPAAKKAADKPSAKGSAASKKPAAKAAKATKSAEADAPAVPRQLEDRTKEQLYSRAQELEIEGRSQMSKDELIEAIRKK